MGENKYNSPKAPRKMNEKKYSMKGNRNRFAKRLIPTLICVANFQYTLFIERVSFVQLRLRLGLVVIAISIFSVNAARKEDQLIILNMRQIPFGTFNVESYQN